MKIKAKHFIGNNTGKLLRYLALGLMCAGLSTGALAQTKAQTKEQTKASKLASNKASIASKVKGLLFEIRPIKQDDMWQDKDSKMSPPLGYLFGTIQIAKKDFYPLSAPVQKAYTQADTVVVEIDSSSDTAAQTLANKLSYSAPDTLEKHISPVVWGTLKAMAGKSIDQFQTYTPALVAMGLKAEVTMQLGYDPEQSLDLHFINAARADNKALVELDSIEFQADVLASLNDDEGNALLANTLDSFRKGELKSRLQAVRQAWLRADADVLGKLLVETSQQDAGSQKITHMLMDDKNERIATRMHDMMRQGKKAFFVVDAGHMAGERSIIAQLKQQGLQVKQIR